MNGPPRPQQDPIRTRPVEPDGGQFWGLAHPSGARCATPRSGSGHRPSIAPSSGAAHRIMPSTPDDPTAWDPERASGASRITRSVDSDGGSVLGSGQTTKDPSPPPGSARSDPRDLWSANRRPEVGVGSVSYWGGCVLNYHPEPGVLVAPTGWSATLCLSLLVDLRVLGWGVFPGCTGGVSVF